MTAPSKPVIMTATMGDADFAWANRLRRTHFPPERNHLSAHITLFHHLPPAYLDEIETAVKRLAELPPPEAELSRLLFLGRGVAYEVRSPELLAMRMELADRFAGLLTPQDENKPRLHITVQNKVPPKDARALMTELESAFERRAFAIKGIALHYYMDGPWQDIGAWSFRG